MIPHEGQLAVLNDTSSRKLVVTGARWGKTVLSCLIAIKSATSENPQNSIIFKSSYTAATDCMRTLVELLEERHIKFTVRPNDYLVEVNGCTIYISVYRFPNGNIIMDDAFEHSHDITIIFTPLGWSYHHGTAMDNPCLNIPNDLHNMYSHSQSAALFDGDFNSAWDIFKKFCMQEYNREPRISRSTFNKIIAENEYQAMNK